MATKRMFSQNIIGSDAFMDMPIGSQLLYFHLGMEADDDGFIGNPKKVMRGIGCKDDDLKVLLSKKFVLMFENGVLVIKHHRINNNWDSYNCKRTIYVEEFSQLFIKDNKAYTLDKTQGIQAQSEISLKSDGKQSLEEKRREEKRILIQGTKVPSYKFVKPTLKEIQDYCEERKNSVNASQFLNHYESNGWKVGKNPMKNWKAAIHTWEKNDIGKNKVSKIFKIKNTETGVIGKKVYKSKEEAKDYIHLNRVEWENFIDKLLIIEV